MRIYWTRARARAAQVIQSVPQEPSSKVLGVTLSSKSTKRVPAVDPTEDTIAGRHMRKLRSEILLELGEEVAIVSEEWTRSLYADMVSEHALDSYLASLKSGYREGEQRWAQIPQRPTDESDLYGPIFNVISHILSELGETCGEGVTRQVVNSHTSSFKHPNYKNICPDISIKATGPSFQRGREEDDYIVGIGYSSVASVIDVRLDHPSNDLDQAIQAGFCCRQIYMQQPNRNFVRSLVITENSVRMLHYDRSGFYLTPLINIHRHPRTFIRLVLGISSPNETVLGLDTSIQWQINSATGAKNAGTIVTVDGRGHVVPYQLNMTRPPFLRRHILGRGTTCWYATDPETGAEVVIKDAWRTESKILECDLMTAARGIDGVVQMLRFQDHCAETEAYRPPGFGFGAFERRTKSRTVMQLYGRSIECFTSRYQAISALRDALVGHRDLHGKGVLHRDVSSQNILLGPPNASPGHRGVLIDLDMACWTWASSELRAEVGLGTRRFQSTAVLHNFELKLPPRHDHLDDLESFYNVLCHLVLLYEAPGKRSKEVDDWLRKCETTEDTFEAGVIKAGFVIRFWAVSPWWGDACTKLLRSFRTIVNDIAGDKGYLQRTHKKLPEEKRDALEAMAKEHEGIYDKVIELFDDALASIEKEDNISNSTPTATSADPGVASDKPKAIASLKRRSTDEHPDAPPPKRLSPPPIAHAAGPENLPSPEVRPQAPLPRLRRSNRSIPTADPTPAPPAGPHPKVIAIRKDAPAKRSLPASNSKARANPKKRTQGTRPKASPPKAVRRSARLNRA
ncbi:hypothetical protein D9611_005914 [Ephemerocybe angulata]|uniref:Protein kinase domain-containing protein n=1 Tax=Ephemerocybe angulata TaxID=980116 RepID=A0A8H5CFV3_9AGAR|nr:hypothetical protein D9611_005914 [Tulosesus angulatus]